MESTNSYTVETVPPTMRRSFEFFEDVEEYMLTYGNDPNYTYHLDTMEDMVYTLYGVPKNSCTVYDRVEQVFLVSMN